jgi:membrane protein implicated in regulation of membrane protease activity
VNNSLQLALLLLAEGPDISPVSGLASLLQTYGAWGLVAVLMVVIWFLFNKYQAARDKNDTTLEAQVRGSTGLVEESVKASVELKNSLDRTTEALKAVERRLENVEDKLG